jgi:hypothetical protein
MNFKRGLFVFLLYVLTALAFIPGARGLTVDDSPVFIFTAPANTVYFIYSDTDASRAKPLGVGYASPIDWTATGFIYGMTVNVQRSGIDTDASLVDCVTGAPKISNAAIVMSGGPGVQVLVKYFEGTRLAPVYYQLDGSTAYWYRSDGTRIDPTAMALSDLTAGHKDIFVVEHFPDASGNAVLVIYGYGGKGTFAGGQFFKAIIYPNIASYTHTYYIFQWNDANGDGFVDLSEIQTTPVAYGD